MPVAVRVVALLIPLVLSCQANEDEDPAAGGSGGALGLGGAQATGGADISGGADTSGAGDAPQGGNDSSGGDHSSGGNQPSGGDAGASGGSKPVTGGTAGATAGSAGSDDGGAGGAPPHVALDGRRLLLDGAPFHIKGVCWNPVPKGMTHPAGLDFAGFAMTDIELMQAAGINTVRTYEPLVDRTVLDRLYQAGIYVLDSVYVYGGDDPEVVTERIEPILDHPAILMWVLGNEWNYNTLYIDSLSEEQARDRINQAASLLQAVDPSHPVASIHGEVPSSATIAAMPDIDVWGVNAYRGLSFGDLFEVFRDRSERPLFLGEYGADAYNALIDGYDPESQAEAVQALTQELLDESAALHDDGTTLGGTVFEWADEWWKDSSGSADTHDVGGVAPGGGPYPDQTFNEEWWGIVDIDREPRPAYDALGDLFLQ